MQNKIVMQLGNFQSLVQLFDYFKDEQTCKLFLEQQRWKGKPCCPHCQHDKVYRTNRGYKCASPVCKKKFSVTSGTIFEHTKIKLRYWFAAIYLMSAHKKGISSHQLARDLNVCQKTSWFMLHRIRQMITDQSFERLNNIVEVDETFVGGKQKNRHKKKKEEIRLSGSKDKTIVVGFLQRNGKVKTVIVPDTTAESLVPAVYENIEEDAMVMTDDHKGYNSLSKDYFHEKVQHSRGEYVRGLIHTNSIEGYWSQLKRGIIGVYHQVSRKHLIRYCNEFNYRYNTRRMKDPKRFQDAFSNIEQRLTWNDLIRQ